MARIFLSYSSSDRELSAQTAAFLEAAGHEVWWDTDLISGESYRSIIDHELDTAQVVIVVWTPTSVQSQWVIAEADHAMRLGKVLPLRTNTVKDWQIPKPFGTLHTETVVNRGAVLNAVEHIANRGDREAERSEHSVQKAHDAAQRTAEVSAETQIGTYLVSLGLLLVGGSFLAAFWRGPNDIDKATLLLAGGAITAVLVVALCLRLCRGTRNPVYNSVLTSTLSNIGIHAWLVVGAIAAYGVKDGELAITLSAGLGAIAIYAVLLVLQLRGAAWVFPAARLLAFVQAGALAAHAARQWGWALDRNSWFTTHPFAFLHLLYVATGVSGAAIAIAFLIASYMYATRAMQVR